MRVVELKQGTPAWKAWRQNLVGGSDAPVIDGVSPHKTIRELYFEKKGFSQAADEDDNEFIFSKGHATEELIRRQFTEMTGVEMIPLCAEHDKFNHIGVSLDGINPKLGVLEAKLVGLEVLKRAREFGEIPIHHNVQIQHQLLVTEADVCHWYGHDGKKNGICLEVKPDQEIAKKLLEKEHAFWERVEHGMPPELTEKDYLIPDDLSLLNQIRETKELMENASVFLEALKKQAIETYKHPKIRGAGVMIYRSERKGSLNYMKVPEIERLASTLTPAYLEQFRGKPVTAWTLAMEKKGVKNG